MTQNSIQDTLDFNNANKNHLKSGTIGWTSPSNLAIIKYWGKYGDQFPQNPSISFTLDKSFTRTEIKWEVGDPSVEVFFEGKKNDGFARRLNKVAERLNKEIPILEKLKLKVDTTNTFPHSAGIASSASAMSAFALGLCSIENYYLGNLGSDQKFFEKASHCSRLGSGSAARSVYGGWVEWGASSFDRTYSNEYASKVDDVHEEFMSIKDSILIISGEEKSVSSTAGHNLMIDNPYAEVRFKQAKDRISELSSALSSGDWEKFGFIAESEALTLHSLMMSSISSYILMRPNSITAIERLREFRRETGLPIYFSLDAGPNLHILYPASIERQALDFINNELSSLCQDGRIIHDGIGQGPNNYLKV